MTKRRKRSHKPNAKTLAAMADCEARRNLIEADTVDELLEKLNAPDSGSPSVSSSVGEKP